MNSSISSAALTAADFNQSLTGFANTLRRHHFIVTTDDLVTAEMACAILKPHSLLEFYLTIHPCLVKSSAQDDLFRKQFWEYFSPRNDTRAEEATGQWAMTLEPAIFHSATPSPQKALSKSWKHALLQRLANGPRQLASFEAFLEGHYQNSAIFVFRHPLTQQDKTWIVRHLAALARQQIINPENWPNVEEVLQRYRRLIEVVERLSPSSFRSVRSNRDNGYFHQPEHLSSSDILHLSTQEWNAPLAPLPDTYRDTLTAAIHSLAKHLQGDFSRGHEIRRKHLVFNYRQTIKRSLATFGEPAILIKTARPRRIRRIVTLCDISGSVQSVSSLFLAFLYGLHQIFEGRIRHFAFVSSADEITRHFAGQGYHQLIYQVLNHASIDYQGFSDYGELWKQMTRVYASVFDDNPIVFVLGDARSNRYPPEVDRFRAISRRVHAIYWLNPEPRSQWNLGDSSVARYKPYARFVEIARFNQLVDFLQKLPGMVIL